MTNLPIFQDPNKNFMLHQTSWKAAILPVMNNEINQGILLTNIPLINGATTINHLLSRKQQGWMIADVNAAATIYRSQPLNDKTLTLTSNAACLISIWVF
jgi:hypothetical protein